MRKSPRQKKAERRIGELVRLGRCWLECGYEAGFKDGLAGQAIYSYK